MPCRGFDFVRKPVICALLFLLACESPAAPERTHPFLFVGRADMERALNGVRHNTNFAALARDLVSLATTNRFEDLPPLEREWWNEAKTKPWRDTYPLVFHHTWSVPMKWGNLARICARASLLSSSTPLSAKAKRILLSLSDYSFEFDHYDVGMNYTIWALAALEAYDILYSGFDQAERSRIDAFFDRYLGAVQKSDNYWIEHEPGGKLNNHYAWHKLGLCMIGLFYGRPELVQHSLKGPKGVEYMLDQGFKDDGLWLEGSIPYQFAETAPLVIMARMLDNAGYPENLFGYRAPNGHSIKQAYDALLPLLFPDGTLPAIGDCYAKRPHIAQHPEWEVLFRQFREPAYAWVIENGPGRTLDALFNGLPDLPPMAPPSQPGKVWPEMGYVALRSDETSNYWTGHGWSAFATFSGQAVHQHADKLSLILFADGHLWLPDCEASTSAEHAFSSVIQTTLNRETLCHNTLLVDQLSQRFPGQRLDLIEFTNAAGLRRVTFGDLRGRLYEGVRQLRTLWVCSDYVLDFFQVDSANPHEFAWVTHVAGEPAGAGVRPTNSVVFPPGPPWCCLRDARSAGATSRLWEAFSHGGHTFRMDLLTDGPAEFIHCGFPRDDSPTPQTIPMRLLKRQGRRAWFLALYQMVGKADHPAELIVTPLGPEQTEITVRISGRLIHQISRRLHTTAASEM